MANFIQRASDSISGFGQSYEKSLEKTNKKGQMSS